MMCCINWATKYPYRHEFGAHSCCCFECRCKNINKFNLMGNKVRQHPRMLMRPTRIVQVETATKQLSNSINSGMWKVWIEILNIAESLSISLRVHRLSPLEPTNVQRTYSFYWEVSSQTIVYWLMFGTFKLVLMHKFTGTRVHEITDANYAFVPISLEFIFCITG